MARKLQAEATNYLCHLLARQEALFAMVEKLTQTASLASNRRKLKRLGFSIDRVPLKSSRTASSCLRRAQSLCSKRVEAGHLAG